MANSPLQSNMRPAPEQDNSLDGGVDPALLQEIQQGQRALMATSLDKAMDVNPEKAAETQRLAQKMNMPVALVEGREEEMQREYNMRQERLDLINKNYPALRDSLKDSDFANASHDDLEKLMRVEEIAPAVAKGTANTFDRTLAGVEAASKFPAFLAYRFTDDPERKDAILDFIVNRAKTVNDIDNRAPGYIRDFSRQYSGTSGFFEPLGVILKNPRAATGVFGAQMPGQMALPLSTAYAGGVAGGVGASVIPGVGTAAGGVAGSMAGMYAGSAINNTGVWVEQELQNRGVDLTDKEAVRAALDDPKLSDEIYSRATRYGLTVGAIDAVFNGMAGKTLAAAKGTGAKNVAKAVGKEMGVQAVGNAASEGGGQLLAYEGDASQISGRDVLEEILVGTGMNAAEITVGAARHPAHEPSFKQAAEAAINEKTAQMDAAHAAVRDSKLAERNPALLKSLVEKAAPGEEIYIDGAAGVEFFQSLPPDRQEGLRNVVPDLDEKLKEAAAAGTDIPVSKADYFAYIAPHAEADTLKDHIRFGPDDFTIDQLNRIDDLVAENQEFLNEEHASLSEAEIMGRRIEQELMNAGRSPEVAKLEALLAQTNMETFQQRYGGNEVAQAIIDEAYRALSVRGPQAQPFSRRKVDNMDLLIDSLRKEVTGAKRAPALPREKKYPVLNLIKSMGGVRRGSPLFDELSNIGVENKTLPGIFRRAGADRVRGFFGMQGGETRAAIDNIPVSEWTLSDAPPTTPEGYVDPQFILEAVRAELGGKPVKSANDYADARPEDALAAELDRLGIDISKASNEDIKKALAGVAAADQANELFQDAISTESKAFKKWFDGSQVVDENGNPLVVYHGSNTNIDKFDRDFSAQGVFWFTSDKEKIIRGESGAASTRHIIPVYLSAKKLAGWPEYEKYGLQEIRELGFDGIKLDDDYVVFEPEQIKSVYNNGSFSKKNPNIFYQGGEDQPRGSIKYFPDGKTIINVFEGADLSTVIHELGHFYWGLFDKLQKAGALNEFGLRDYAVIREFVGAKEGEAFTVDQEEKIARAFEAYLMEGKAPSVDLQNAFARFKAWLTRIYKNVAALDVRLNDDVRQVFDRMLATDEAINSIRDNRLFRPDDAVLAVLSAEQKEAYLRQGEKAAQSAKDKLFRRSLRQVERANTKWWKAERERVRNEVETRVNAASVYQALDAMQKGIMPDGTPLGEPVRLSRKMLKDQFGEELFKYMPRATVAKTGGSDPAVVAEMFGFRSADSMVKAMINAEDKKTKIERLIDEEMIQRHGDMLTDGTLEREAVETYHNADRAEQLATELKTVSEIAGVGAAKPAEFKAAAERILGTKKVDDAIKSSRFYYAEVRAAREFGRAIAKKDYVQAADAKRRQLLNHYLFRLARDADKEIQSAIKRFNKLEKPPIAGKVKIDEDYHNKIRDILDGFGFGARMGRAKETRLELQALAEWMKAKETDDEAQLMIPPEILDAQRKTHFRDLTLEEFRGLRDMVYNIETQGRRKLEYQINGVQRAFDEVKANLLDQAEKALPVIPRAVNPSPLGELKEKFFSVQIKAREYFRQLDSGDRQGVFHDAILADIDKGVDRLHIRMKEAADKFRSLLDAAYTREELAKMGRDKFFIEGLGDGITKENLLVMALNWGNEGNREALLRGNGWDHNTVSNVLDEKLTVKDWLFVQGVWDWFDSYWPEISKLEKKRKGFTPQKVERLPFIAQIIDEEGKVGAMALKGGYFPIIADPRRSITAKEQTLDQAMDEMRAGSMAAAATRRGHTVARVGVGLDPRPLLLSFSTIQRHVNTVLRDIELGEAVHQASRLLRNREIKNSLADRIGLEGYRALDIWLKDVAVGDIPLNDFFTKIQDKLRANASIAYMGFSLSTMVQQPSGLTNTAAVLGDGGRGWKWVGVGAMNLLKSYISDGQMNINEIHDVSEFMRMRAQTFQRDINDVMQLIDNNVATRAHIGKNYMPHDYKKWFLWHIQKVQGIVDAISWLGAHEKATREGMSPERAVKYADDVVRAQASGLIQDMSGIERGSTTATSRFNKYTKLFTFMFSYWNAKFNVAYGKTADFRAGRISGGQMAVDMISLIWLDAFIGALLTGALPGQTGDDDKDGGVLDWTWWAFKQPFSMIPLGRDIPNAVEGFPTGDGPFAGLMNATKNAVQQAKQGELDAAAVRAAIGLTGLLVGIPSSQINRFVSMVDRIDNNKEVGYIDFIRQRKPNER